MRVRLSSPPVVFALLATLWAGCTAEPVPSDDDLEPHTGSTGFHPGSWVENATWATRHHGDLVVSVTLVSNHTTECTIHWTAWGVSTHLVPTAGIIIEGTEERDRMDVDRGQGNMDPQVAVHAGGVVDEEASTGPFGWATGYKDTRTLIDAVPLNVTVFGTGMRVDDSDGLRPHYASEDLGDNSTLLKVACAAPVQVVSLAWSEEVVVFNEATLRGGAGAHTFGGFDATGASLASRVAREIASDQGVLALSIFGDLLLNHVAVGAVEVEYPGGQELYVDRPSEVLVDCGVIQTTCPLVDRLIRAGPGTYAVTATYASLDAMGVMEGAILGLEPAEDLP